MKKIILIAFPFLISLLLISNCQSITDNEENSATLAVYLTDAPANYDSVIVVFSEISAHIDSQWVHVTQEQRRVNLLEWSNGETLLLGSNDVPAGKYTQVRIKIDSAFIGVDGNVYEMKVPSGAQTGLKLGPQFTIADGSEYKIVLDFNADKSVVVHGTKHNPHSYSLKPHIRMIAYAVTGSISGIVTNPEHLPLARAIIGSDTIATSIVDTSGGFFKLAFLPDSIYSVAITDTMDQSYSAESVEVNAGQNNNLGQITLQ